MASRPWCRMNLSTARALLTLMLPTTILPNGMTTCQRAIFISEECRQELQKELEIHLAELIEEVGEPTAEEMARAEAWWRPIEQHLKKGSTRSSADRGW